MKQLNRMYIQYTAYFPRSTYKFNMFENDPGFEGYPTYYRTFILRLFYE